MNGGFLIKHSAKSVTGGSMEEALGKACKEPVVLCKILSF